MREKGNSVETTAMTNNKTYACFFNMFYSIALSVFEWLNLPPTINPRFLETVLFWHGQAIFFSDEEVGAVALPVMPCGDLDLYNIPKVRDAYSPNGYHKSGLTKDNSVLCYNNYTKTPDALQLQMYAKRLYEIERTIDVNVKAQKTPLTVVCDEKQRLTMKNLYMQYDGNSPFIFANKNLDVNGIKVLKTDAPFISDKLQILKRQYWQEALTFLGVEANTSEKAERLVSGEVTSNLGGTEALRLTRLNARKDACAELNNLFHFDPPIDVRFRSNLTLSKIMDGESEETEGNENE